MSNSPRVFLSHTTRDNRDLALAKKLAQGLRQKGAQIWIAPDSIPVGEKWEEHIVSGIMKQCSHFLVVLSAASVKAPWVIEEIRLARERHAHQPDFKLVPLITGTLEDYPEKKFIDSLQRVPYHDDFHAQLEAVAQGLELRPTVPGWIRAFVTEKTRDFVGRSYVFEALHKFLAENDRGYFIIEGDPGIGKSAILAESVVRSGYLAHFNIRSQGITTARQFLENVATQLIARFGLDYASLPGRATEDGTFLSKLLEEAGGQLGEGERVVIAVDGLDEVDLTGHVGNILYLPGFLPERVYFVLTRRQTPLPLTLSVPQVLFDLVKYQSEGLKDVEIYILQKVSDSPPLRAWLDERGLAKEEFAVALAAKSEGNFMYARHVLPDIAQGFYPDLEIESLPLGLEAYYEDHWQRMGMTARPLPRAKINIIYVLSVAERPISRALIADFASEHDLRVDERTAQEVLGLWDEFIRESVEDGTKQFSFYHASFRDFLHRKDIVEAAGLDLANVHGRIADTLWPELFDE